MSPENRLPPLRVGVPIPKGLPTDGGGFEFQEIIFSEVCQRNNAKQLSQQIQFIPILTSGGCSDRWNLASGQYVNLVPRRTLQMRSSLHAGAKRVLQGKTEIPYNSTLIRRQALATLKQEFDLIWHLNDQIITDQVPYIITIWDLQHRLQPLFPEVSQEGAWEEREKRLKKAVAKASLVITGTQQGANEAHQIYQIDNSRLLANPFPCPPKASFSTPEKSDFLASNDLQDGRFLLYPAQFWPHKNHVAALMALRQLLDEGHNFKLVLTGSDKGALRSTQLLIDNLSLRDWVVYCGFVSRKSLSILYSSAFALIFPSFFGPDNIPPLEAMSYGTPALVADVPGSEEQFGDSALRFNPNKPAEIVELINRLVQNNDLRSTLIANGERLTRSLTASRYVDKVTSWIGNSSVAFHCIRLWQR